MPSPSDSVAVATHGAVRLDGLSSAEAEARRRRVRTTGLRVARPAATGGSCGPTSSTSTTASCSSSAARCSRSAATATRSSASWIGLLNAVISAVQEIRAKRQLDRLQLLGRGTVVVVRDGRDTEVLPEEVVRGDVVRVRPGDQLVVDGPVLDGRRRGGRVAADRGVGARSCGRPGRTCSRAATASAAAGCSWPATSGAASYASRLTAEARQATTDTTPLQRQIAFCVRLVMVARGPDERGHPAAGRAGGPHAGPGRADRRGAVRAGALRPVLPHRRSPTPRARSPPPAAGRWCSGSTRSSR